jgi:hypothetical protein
MSEQFFRRRGVRAAPEAKRARERRPVLAPPDWEQWVNAPAPGLPSSPGKVNRRACCTVAATWFNQPRQRSAEVCAKDDDYAAFEKAMAASGDEGWKLVILGMSGIVLSPLRGWASGRLRTTGCARGYSLSPLPGLVSGPCGLADHGLARWRPWLQSFAPDGAGRLAACGIKSVFPVLLRVCLRRPRDHRGVFDSLSWRRFGPYRNSRRNRTDVARRGI